MEGKLHAGGVALIDAHPMWAYPTEGRTRDNGNMDDSLESLLGEELFFICFRRITSHHLI